MRRLMLLALALVLTAGVTTVFAWPMVFSGDGDAADRQSLSASEADDPPPPPPHLPGHAANHLDKVLGHLHLSKEQKPKVEKILKGHHEAVHKFMDKARAEVLKEMKSVLTMKQYAEFEKLMKHHGHDGHAPKGPRENDRHGKVPPPPPPSPPDRD